MDVDDDPDGDGAFATERRLPVLLLLVTLAFTAVVCGVFWRSSRARDAVRFQNAAEAAENAVVGRLETYVAMLRGGVGLFSVSERVTRREFAEYVEHLEVETRYPGVQGIGFAQRAGGATWLAVEAALRRDHGEAARIWPEGPRDEAYPIVFLEPLDRRNQAAVGYDMFAEAVRREAMARARDTGLPAMSGRVTLVQEIDEKKQAGFLIYVPWYGQAAPEGVEQRRARIAGFAYSPFRADDLFAGVFGGERDPRVILDIYDGPRVEEGALLHRSYGDGVDAARAAFSLTITRELYGRPWTMVIRSSPSFDARSRSFALPLLAFVGLVAGTVLFGGTRSLVRAREEARTLNRIGRRLSAELDLQRLLQESTEAGRRLCGAEIGAFFFNDVDERGEQYMLYTLSGAPRAAFAHMPNPRKTEIFGPTFRGERIMRFDDVTKDPRYGKNEPHRGMPPGHPPVRSYLAVPVRSRGGGVLGGLFFGHADAGRFSVEHERLVAGIASQAAIALDNAQLLRQAQSAVRLRDEFIAVASHELKTPLSALRLHTESSLRHLQKEARGDEDPIVRRLNNAALQVDRLTALVDQLLDVGRIAGGRLALELDDVDLAHVAREVVERLADDPPSLSSRVTLEAPEPVVGRWDRMRVEQIVTNLLTNAIKYGGDGPIRVAVRTEAGAGVLVVEDRGIGIPKDQQARLFGRFERIASSRNFGGLGLGLWITHQIVEAFGGEIDVASEEGRGSTFTVRLPQRPPPPAQSPSPPP